MSERPHDPRTGKDAASLSDEDVERRLGGDAGVRVMHVRRPGVDVRRRPDARGMLVRDSVTILAAAVITVLAWQLLGAGVGAPAGGSQAPIETGIALGSVGAPPTLGPFTTLGPIANASIGLGATPTPVPFTTLGPTELNVVVAVTNDNGGNDIAANWTITVTGAGASPAVFQGSATGVTVSMNPGQAFSIVTKAKTPGGYVETRSGNCTGPIAKGGSPTCTIAENDKPVTMTVKVVFKGTTAKAVTVSVAAAGVDRASFPGSATGTVVHFNANAKWTVTTTPPVIANYTRTSTSGCSSTTGAAEGATVTCTFTFTYVPTPPPTLPPAPIAAFTCTSVGGGSNTVSFTDDSTGQQSSWSWNFGDGLGTSTAQSPGSYTYALPNTYTVTLTVTGPGGQSSVSHDCIAN